MSKESTPFNLRNVIKGGIVTAFLSSTLSFVYNVVIRQLFLEKGDLVYQEVITHFQENQKKYSVCNITVINNGNGIVENVTFSLSLKGKDENLKCSYQQSSLHIRVYTQPTPTTVDTLENNIYALPYLNSTENITYECKVSGYINTDNIRIELRGKGYIGHLQNQENGIERFERFYWSLLSLLLSIIFLLIFLLYKRKRGVIEEGIKKSIEEVEAEK